MNTSDPLFPSPTTEEMSSAQIEAPSAADEANLEVSEAQRKEGLMRFIFDVLETLVISLVLFAGVNLISARIRVEGFSMEPTFHNGELVIVNKLAYRFSLPERGDVVIFHYPRNPKEEFIKRVIGLPGEQISVRNGKVFINGQELEEPYIASPPNYTLEAIVPEGTVYVLGDNRNNSSDSHNWGSLPLDMIIGKAVFVYWPPSNIGLVKHYDIQVKENTASAAQE